MLNNWQVGTLGSSRVEENIREMLMKFSLIRKHDGSTRSVEDNDLQLIEKIRLIEDICVRFCFVTTRERGIKIQSGNFFFCFISWTNVF